MLSARLRQTCRRLERRLVLLCLSLSVVSSPSQDLYLMWEPDGRVINKTLIDLHKSPLFPRGISAEQLISPLSSLEMLFSCEDDYINHSMPRSLALERNQKPEAEGDKTLDSFPNGALWLFQH